MDNGQPRQSIHGDRGDPGSTFNQSIFASLKRLEYRLINTGDDLEAIYRLRYHSYVQSGMVSPNATGKVFDRYDELDNAYRFGVYIDGQLVSTLRLHHITSESPDAPAATIYSEYLRPRLDRGETFIEGTRFAADTEKAPSPGALPFLTLRLGMVASCYFKQTSVLTAIKPEHSAFYRRVFNATQVTEPASYPGLSVPVILFQTPCGDNLQATLNRFPFFKSTATEQRLLFGPRKRSESYPLTVLPTAKYVREAA